MLTSGAFSTNPGKVTTREVAALIRRTGVSDKIFQFFTDEAEFMRIGLRDILGFADYEGAYLPDGELLVAIRAPELPEYYSANMDLRVEIDRGDVWYEFPYDEHGVERARRQAERREPRRAGEALLRAAVDRVDAPLVHLHRRAG